MRFENLNQADGLFAEGLELLRRIQIAGLESAPDHQVLAGCDAVFLARVDMKDLPWPDQLPA